LEFEIYIKHSGSDYSNRGLPKKYPGSPKFLTLFYTGDPDMSIRILLTMGCSLIMASESLAQYNQPTPQYQHYQQQPNMNGPATYHASARLRQDQAVTQATQPRATVMEAPVYQAPQAGNAVPPPLVPSMVAPSYNQGIPNGNQVGQNYLDSSDGCCEGETSCGPDRYLRLFGGWNVLEDVEFALQSAQQGEASFNDGWAIGGAIGQYRRENIRGELEFTYRNNTVDSVLTPSPAPLDGLINCYSPMGNLVYESGMQMGGFKPYFGGGLGIAFLTGELVGFANIDDTVFAYQGFIGVNRQLSSEAKLFAEYRYFATSEFDIDGLVSTSDEYQASNLFFGLQLSR
jgi:opacity protein-like surface antigen